MDKKLKNQAPICCGVLEELDILWLTLEDGTKCIPVIKGSVYTILHRLNYCPFFGTYIRDIVIDNKRIK